MTGYFLTAPAFSVRLTEGVGWHYSHLEGKQVFGFQIHAAIVSTGSHALCYSLQHCCPEHGTKVDICSDSNAGIIIRRFRTAARIGSSACFQTVCRMRFKPSTTMHTNKKRLSQCPDRHRLRRLLLKTTRISDHITVLQSARRSTIRRYVPAPRWWDSAIREQRA